MYILINFQLEIAPCNLKQTAHLECNSIFTKRKLQNYLKWEPIRVSPEQKKGYFFI
jgi:hypothetical protein